MLNSLFTKPGEGLPSQFTGLIGSELREQKNKRRGVPTMAKHSAKKKSPRQPPQPKNSPKPKGPVRKPPGPHDTFIEGRKKRKPTTEEG